MNKWLRQIIIVGLLFLSACASNTSDLSISFRGRLTYSTTTFTFEQLAAHDILYSLQDSVLDFVGVVQVTQAVTLDAYADILVTMQQVTDQSEKQFGELIRLTSSQFNDQATSAGVLLSIDDIVQFNDLKEYVATLPSSVSMTKLAYLEFRVGRSLTSEEQVALEYLQVAFNAFDEAQQSTDLTCYTYDEFVTTYETIRKSPLDALSLERLATAYQVLSLIVTFS